MAYTFGLHTITLDVETDTPTIMTAAEAEERRDELNCALADRDRALRAIAPILAEVAAGRLPREVAERELLLA
jgi:hypothetical protein